MHLNEGESAIPYWDEGPHIWQECESAIRRGGVELPIDETLDQRPPARATPAASLGARDG